MWAVWKAHSTEELQHRRDVCGNSQRDSSRICCDTVHRALRRRANRQNVETTDNMAKHGTVIVHSRGQIQTLFPDAEVYKLHSPSLFADPFLFTHQWCASAVDGGENTHNTHPQRKGAEEMARVEADGNTNAAMIAESLAITRRYWVEMNSQRRRPSNPRKMRVVAEKINDPDFD